MLHYNSTLYNCIYSNSIIAYVLYHSILYTRCAEDKVAVPPKGYMLSRGSPVRCSMSQHVVGSCLLKISTKDPDKNNK